MFYDLREGVLKQTLKVSTIMEKIDKLEKLNYIKIKNAYALKDTTKQWPDKTQIVRRFL